MTNCVGDDPGALNRQSAVAAVLSTVLLILVAAVGNGCSPDKRKALVIYSPHGKELLSHYEKSFEAAHPNVDVQWIDMGGQNAEDRIRTERSNPQASLWWGGAGMAFDRAAREGLLEPYQPSWADAVAESARGKDHTWYGTFLTPEVIAYNTVALDSAAVPRTWDDLLEPEWKGRVLIRYPLASSTMRTIFGAMILRQESVEKGYEWLARLDQNVKTYTADPTQLYLKLARGEGDITLWNLPDIYLQATTNGYPFGSVVPSGGTPVLVDGIALVKGGPNLDVTREFYEFVTTDSALVQQADKYFRIPVRSDIGVDGLPEWMAAIHVDALPIDWDRLAREGPTWMQYWDEQIKGRGSEYLSERK